MRIDHLVARWVAATLVFLVCGVPQTAMAMTGQEVASTQPQQSKDKEEGSAVPVGAPKTGGTTATPESGSPGTGQLPDSPGAVRFQAASQPPQKSDQLPPPPLLQSLQSRAQKPVGAAAAEIENTTGTAASKPAGVAIAPAPQKRTRSLLIKIGALAGAGIAVGTALALSQATPSKPPGAH